MVAVDWIGKETHVLMAANSTLTLRQRSIATLRGAGFSRAEISGAMRISGSTYDREVRAMAGAARETAARREASDRSSRRMAEQLAAVADE